VGRSHGKLSVSRKLSEAGFDGTEQVQLIIYDTPNKRPCLGSKLLDSANASPAAHDPIPKGSPPDTNRRDWPYSSDLGLKCTH
jgi:hypothetical protein